MAPYDQRHFAARKSSMPRQPIALGPCIALAALCASLQALPARAAEPYPQRAITLMVPFPSGGTTDIIGRAVAQGLARHLGQTVVVENKAGAGGTVGALQVLRAAPDGYTLLLGGPADQVNAPLLMAKPPYDAGRDFEPVGCIMRSPNVLVVNAKLPINTLAQLLAHARAQPARLNYASAGNGNTSHLSGELLALTAGVELTHVPYRGNAPAITDTIGGQVQMMFSSPVSVAQHIKSGALRALAVTSATRIAGLPQVPTLREAGVAVDVYSWACLVAPARTPPEVLERLHAALARTLEEPTLAQVAQAAGGETFPTTREEARRFLASERATWGHLIRSRNIQAD